MTTKAEGLRVSTLPAESTWLRANVREALVGVDQLNRIIKGYVVAQEGAFLEPDPRGEFNAKSLQKIVELMNARPNGTKVRFGHPSASGDSLGKYIGRAKDARLDAVTVDRDGEKVQLQAVRADLHLSPSAFAGNPNGNLGDYILQLASEDPTAFASSLVLQIEKEVQLNAEGKPKKDARGKLAPPLWKPTAIHASDLVDEGAAVDAFLSVEDRAGLPDAALRQAAELLEVQFAGCGPDVIRARCVAWLDRYLSWRFPTDEEPIPAQPEAPPAAPHVPNTDEDRHRRLRLLELEAADLTPTSQKL